MLKRSFFLISLSIPLFAYLSPTDTTLEKAEANKTDSTKIYLKYQSHDSDFLVFYDLEGATLLLRYRIDRWDYENDSLRDSLTQGTTYIVALKNFKKLGEGELPAGIKGAGLKRVPTMRKIRRIRDVYVGDLVAINESALRDLRY